MTTDNPMRKRLTKTRISRPLQRLVRGRLVDVWNSGPSRLENKHGYTKHGHGRHYISVGDRPNQQYLDKAWDRRCDASRWAKRAGAKEVHHWYLI